MSNIHTSFHGSYWPNRFSSVLFFSFYYNLQLWHFNSLLDKHFIWFWETQNRLTLSIPRLLTTTRTSIWTTAVHSSYVTGMQTISSQRHQWTKLPTAYLAKYSEEPGTFARPRGPTRHCTTKWLHSHGWPRSPPGRRRWRGIPGRAGKSRVVAVNVAGFLLLERNVGGHQKTWLELLHRQPRVLQDHGVLEPSSASTSSASSSSLFIVPQAEEYTLHGHYQWW